MRQYRESKLCENEKQKSTGNATGQGNNISTACVKWRGVNEYTLVLVCMYVCMYGVLQIKMVMKGFFLNNDSNLNGTTHEKN